MCFAVNFAKFLKTPFLTEHLRWLLLFIINFRPDLPYVYKKDFNKVNKMLLS